MDNVIQLKFENDSRVIVDLGDEKRYLLTDENSAQKRQLEIKKKLKLKRLGLRPKPSPEQRTS